MLLRGKVCSPNYAVLVLRCRQRERGTLSAIPFLLLLLSPLAAYPLRRKPHHPNLIVLCPRHCRAARQVNMAAELDEPFCPDGDVDKSFQLVFPTRTVDLIAKDAEEAALLVSGFQVRAAGGIRGSIRHPRGLYIFGVVVHMQFWDTQLWGVQRQPLPAAHESLPPLRCAWNFLFCGLSALFPRAVPPFANGGGVGVPSKI